MVESLHGPSLRRRQFPTLEDDLHQLGLGSGDTVLVRAAQRYMVPTMALGDQDIDAADALLDALLNVVGSRGTVLALTFTSVSLPWLNGRSEPFSESTPATTGKFARAVLRHPRAVRSSHPTNSFAAIGADAAKYLEFQTPYSHCFRPVERLIEDDGKMLLVGCTTVSPGFSTVHVAQYHLGLSNRSLLSNRTVAKYRDRAGRIRTFRKRDVPGCSAGFSRLYPAYRNAEKLRESDVAGAPSMCIDAAAAYAVELAILIEDPRAVLCDRPDCISCRSLLLYNKRDWVSYWAHRMRLPPLRD